VKLLFDQNLSYRLVHALHEMFPESQHVRDVGLGEAADEAVWHYAVRQGVTLISKEADSYQRSLLFGHPPKVVWVRHCYCSTAAIEQLLRLHYPNLIQICREPRRRLSHHRAFISEQERMMPHQRRGAKTGTFCVSINV
jgi:predicted nuclease of predicted toxin-antitoxin system